LPDVPTLKELGYDIEYYLWVGIFAPKGTPPAIVSALTSLIDKAASIDRFKSAIANLGLEGGYLGAQEFSKFWDTDAKRSEEAVALIGRVQG
jgi:tripartite-type tricarboxylate transporter receptor subunit TctC